MHSHCSTELARFPEEFSLSLVSQCHPHPLLFNSFHPQIHFLSLSLLLMPLHLPFLWIGPHISLSACLLPFLLRPISLTSCYVHPTLLRPFLPPSFPSLCPLFSLFFPEERDIVANTQSPECFLSCSDRSTGFPPLSPPP